MQKELIIDLILKNYLPQDFSRLDSKIETFADLKKELENIAENDGELFKKIYIDLLRDLQARAEQE